MSCPLARGGPCPSRCILGLEEWPHRQWQSGKNLRTSPRWRIYRLRSILSVQQTFLETAVECVDRTSYFVSYFVDQREDWRPWMCNTWRTQVPTWHSNIMYQTHPHTFWSKTADTNSLNRYVACSGQADMSSINTLEKPKRQIKLYVSQCKPYRNNPLEFRS